MWKGADERKLRSSKSRKSGDGDKIDGVDDCGKRRSIGDKLKPSPTKSIVMDMVMKQ